MNNVFSRGKLEPLKRKVSVLCPYCTFSIKLCLLKLLAGQKIKINLSNKNPT